MNTSHIVAICLVLIGFAPFASEAWSCPGHMLTASVARQLIGDDVAKFFQPLIDRIAQQYENVSTMTEAACWADDIKSHGMKQYSSWHYADFCYSVDDTPCPPVGDDAGKIMQMLPFIIQNITTSHDIDAQSFDFMFLLHLMGDLHQPLHVISEFSHKFPHGDRGGNLFHVKYSGHGSAEDIQNAENDAHKPLVLHYFCDTVGLLHSYHIERPIENGKIEQMNQLTDELLNITLTNYSTEYVNATSISEWAGKIYADGKRVIYANGDLQPDQKLTEQYVTRARNILKTQLALGGRRLASILTWLYKLMHNKQDEEVFVR